MRAFNSAAECHVHIVVATGSSPVTPTLFRKESDVPNMFGGDQHHPAYDPRTELRDNQVLVGNDLYTVEEDGRVELEQVNGRRVYVSADYLPEVKELKKRMGL